MTTPTLTALIRKELPADVPQPKLIRPQRAGRYMRIYFHMTRESTANLSLCESVGFYPENKPVEAQAKEVARLLAAAIPLHLQGLAEKQARQDEQRARTAAYNKKKLEFLREVKLVAPDSTTMPAYVDVAGLFNVAIESVDATRGTVTLYTQTEVNAQQLVDFLHRSSNLQFTGEQPVERP